MVLCYSKYSGCFLERNLKLEVKEFMRIFCMTIIACLLLSVCSLREEPPARLEAPDAESRTADTVPDTKSPTVQRLTIPEGYTLARIGMTLEEMGVCTKEEFIQATQDGDFSEYPLIATQPENENRCFRLEGYLFPDTYEFYSNESPDAIVRRILNHTEQKISPGLRAEADKLGMNMDEILILASIIEKEAFGKHQMPYISSVLHNRLELDMQLQCDVTINYVEGAIKPFITGDKNRYNDYYNTYKCPALPAGAICNPSLEAIRAAIYPEDTDYLFFVTDADQNYYYAATYEEHLENMKAAGLE